MSGPMKFRHDPNQSLVSEIVGYPIVATVFDGWYERWAYGQFEMFENLLGPSDKAFIVYFDHRGKVVKFRRPISGHYANPPVRPEARSTSP